MSTNKYYGWLGDANPIEHGGGIVYSGEDEQIQVLYFTPYGGDRVSIYQVFLDDDETKNCDWADLESVASYTGIDLDELRTAGSSPDPQYRAMFLEEIARFHGWGELTAGESQESTIEAAEKAYDELFEAAWKALHT